MADTTTWRLLVVDDDHETCSQVKEFLDAEALVTSGDRLHVEILTDFASALDALEVRRFDLLILDVRLGSHDALPPEEIGIRTLEVIRRRRFVPVVFYTGLPRLVQDLQAPLIRVVEKTAGLPRLLEEIGNVFATFLPAVNRALVRHLETVQRDYMWDFVVPHWEQFGSTPDRKALAYLLARRLAMSLSRTGMQQLIEELGNATDTTMVEGLVHPMQYYVMPPVELAPLAGDLYQGQIEEHTGYWVLLTPSCDLVTGREKAERVLLAHGLPLTEQEEYVTWKSNLPTPSNSMTRNLQDLLRDNRRNSQAERFYFLPGALDLPDLVVDFQQLMTLQREQLTTLRRLASLDSPFGEALLARFARYFGRLGTPDLDVHVLLSRHSE